MKVWSEAEKSMQGKETQVPDLLKKDETQKMIWLDDLIALTHEEPQFTRQELQFMKSTFSESLNFISAIKIQVKTKANQYWSVCDKENADTVQHFRTLNQLRSSLRKIKRAEAKLGKLQHKIKKLLSE